VARGPDTAQLRLDLDAPPLALADAVLARGGPRGLSADQRYDAAVDLEGDDPAAAVAAYREALRLDPRHAEAHLNLGRLLHERGCLDEAETHYRAAAEADPASAQARYNLGVVLEDRGSAAEAADAYEAALTLDPDLAAAYFNLSKLDEAAGRRADALGHLAAYKRILDRAGPEG